MNLPRHGRRLVEQPPLRAWLASLVSDGTAATGRGAEQRDISDDLDIRRAALTIAGCVERLDREHLEHLDPAAFDVQLQARIALADHVRDIWEQLKAEGENPAVKPEYQPLAALLDLLTFLHGGDHARPVSGQA